MSAINKANASNKKYHHKLGTGGYKTAVPKWDQSKANLLAAGVNPVTASWPDRSKHWFLGHGGSLDPKTGAAIASDAIKTVSKELEKAMSKVQEGTFVPDRENDELTCALGNPEHRK